VITDQPGTAVLKGNITATGAAGVKIQENDIGIVNDLEIRTTNAGAGATDGQVVLGDPAFVGNISSAGNKNLLINATGPVTFNNAIGQVNALGDVTVNTSKATTFNREVIAKTLQTDQGGTAIIKGNITTSAVGGVNIRELTINLEPTANTLTITANNNGTVSLGGTNGKINTPAANKNLTIASMNGANVGTGNVTLWSALGPDNELGAIQINTGGLTDLKSTVRAVSLTTDQPGTASLGGDITVSGAAGVHINENAAQAVTITGPVKIKTTDPNADVIFEGGVNSTAGTPNDLTVDSQAAIQFKGVLGDNNTIGDLNLKGFNVTTTGSTKANNVTMEGTNLLLIQGNVTSPGYGNPNATNGKQVFKGVLQTPTAVTFEGSAGTIDGVAYYNTGTTNAFGATLTWRYNAAPPAPAGGSSSSAKTASSTPSGDLQNTPNTASNLLTYQLSENSEATPPKTTNTADNPISRNNVDDEVCDAPQGCSAK